MNTSVKVVKVSSYMQHVLPWSDLLPVISLPRLRTALLIVTVLISALGVVYVKDFNRRLFVQYQMLENAQDQLQVDWGKLLLEQGAWSAQSRVQDVAQSQLQMRAPLPKEIVLVKTN